HTVMERLMDEISYDAAEQSGAKFVIDAAYVQARLGDTIEDEDLSRFIL
ncbi:HslU--HslV peptidase ATPase subunit, partial [Vibrio parahaemolyticus]|nr:HslU--HslV peptidase ATPase subunit [Vibrio parahaemolyticus]